jgi:hypothetical protein
MGISGAMIQRNFFARQYLHADQQVCIVAVKWPPHLNRSARHDGAAPKLSGANCPISE